MHPGWGNPYRCFSEPECILALRGPSLPAVPSNVPGMKKETDIVITEHILSKEERGYFTLAPTYSCRQY